MLKPKAEKPKPNWADLRLTDKIAPGVRVLLIGINPGVLSASTGHHFAGPTNRFWPLLYESGLVPVPVTHDDDVRLPEWGLGITNLVARPTPGIDTLKPGEYLEGWKILEAKIAKYRPEIVAFVGVTMYRALWKVLNPQVPGSPKPIGEGGKPGFQRATVHGARLFVLPNPSGRNAHFGYAEMLESFRALRRAMGKLSPPTKGSERAQRSEPRARSAPAKRRARARVGGAGGAKPPG